MILYVRSVTVAARLIVALVVTVPAAAATAAEAPRGALATCATRSEAEFPGGFTNRQNLVVGPLRDDYARLEQGLLGVYQAKWADTKPKEHRDHPATPPEPV